MTPFEQAKQEARHDLVFVLMRCRRGLKKIQRMIDAVTTEEQAQRVLELKPVVAEYKTLIKETEARLLKLDTMKPEDLNLH